MYNEQLATETLKLLNDRYPDHMHLYQLQSALPHFSAIANSEWLRVVDALAGEGKVTGKFLRSGDGLQDAAMLKITAQGRVSLNETLPEGRAGRMDPLLNIADRGQFDHDFPQLCDAATAQCPLSFIFVDIDHFKNVNDNYGHKTGDEVLKQVAVALVAGCKGKGTAYRIGGEEIGILLANHTLVEAEVLGEQLRAKVSIVRGKESPPAITVSIGVAAYPVPVEDPSTLYDAADRALYTAKKSGRNQVRTVPTNVVVNENIPLTRQSLSVYIRTDERVRRLDEEIARNSGQRFDPAEDASLYVCEKAQRLAVRSIGDLAELVRKYGDISQKLARCIVPTTDVPAGHSVSFVLDASAAQHGENALRAYFQSLRYTSTADEYVAELIETLALLS